MDPESQASILVVGYDANFCYLLRSYIRRSAYPSAFTQPRDNVIEIAQREHPVLIILDVDLPEMQGWEILHALKTEHSTCAIPVVICSWLDEQERGKLEKADAYLRMPILFSDFLRILSIVGLSTQSKIA